MVRKAGGEGAVEMGNETEGKREEGIRRDEDESVPWAEV